MRFAMVLVRGKKDELKVNGPRAVETIRGIVIAAGWDSKGSPIGNLIATFDENEYHVEQNEIGKELFQDLRTEIIARGVVRRSKGKKWIRIRHYTRHRGAGGSRS